MPGLQGAAFLAVSQSELPSCLKVKGIRIDRERQKSRSGRGGSSPELCGQGSQLAVRLALLGFGGESLEPLCSPWKKRAGPGWRRDYSLC